MSAPALPVVAGKNRLGTNVVAHGLTLEVDKVARGVRLAAGLLEGGRHGRHVKHAATGGDQLSVGVDGGAGVIDGDAIQRLRSLRYPKMALPFS